MFNVQFQDDALVSKLIECIGRTLDLENLSSVQHRSLKWYLILVDGCRALDRSHIIGWGSYHHILPKASSLYPEYSEFWEPDLSWNRVYLSHREHFVAHHLLYEIYDRSGAMAMAFHRMVHGKGTNGYTTNYTASQLKNWRRSLSSEHRAKISNASRRENLSEETLRRKSEARRNRDPISDETRSRMAESGKVKVFSDKHRENLSATQSNRQSCPEYRKMMSERTTGRKATEEHKASISEGLKGYKKSEEHLNNLGASVSEALRNKKPVPCPHCGVARKRWTSTMRNKHFDNCSDNTANQASEPLLGE